MAVLGSLHGARIQGPSWEDYSIHKGLDDVT